MKPGSKRRAAEWLDANRLRLGRDTFNITAYAEKLGLSAEETSTLCWPVLCSRQSPAAAVVFCQNPDHKDHKGADAPAHRPPKGFSFATLRDDFSEQEQLTPKKSKKK